MVIPTEFGAHQLVVAMPRDGSSRGRVGRPKKLFGSRPDQALHRREGDRRVNERYVRMLECIASTISEYAAKIASLSELASDHIAILGRTIAPSGCFAL